MALDDGCSTRQSGSFGCFNRAALGAGIDYSLGACIELCSRCERCRYVSMSLSPDVMDCSWYSDCELGRTTPDADFVSVSMADALAYRTACRAQYPAEGWCW